MKALAEEFGSFTRYDQSRTSNGQLQLDPWKAEGSQPERWYSLRERIAKYGLRNSLLIAIAPTATIASIAGCYECIEPQVSNLYKRETLSGEFMQVNNALVQELKNLGLWSPEIMDEIKRANGSVQGIMELSEEVRLLFRTAWELPQRALIDLAAHRGPFIDQSQSLNLFIETPTIGKLSSMYLYAWKAGLKSTYYLRSRSASRIAQATVTSRVGQEPSETSTRGSSISSPTSTAIPQPRAESDELILRSNASDSKAHASESNMSESALTSVATTPYDAKDPSIGSTSSASYALAPVADMSTPIWSGPSSTPDDEVIDLDADYPSLISSNSSSDPSVIISTYSDADAIACSLENPENCEACQ